jgi:hypothetical protein
MWKSSGCVISGCIITQVSHVHDTHTPMWANCLYVSLITLVSCWQQIYYVILIINVASLALHLTVRTLCKHHLTFSQPSPSSWH